MSASSSYCPSVAQSHRLDAGGSVHFFVKIPKPYPLSPVYSFGNVLSFLTVVYSDLLVFCGSLCLYVCDSFIITAGFRYPAISILPFPLLLFI